MYEDTTTSYGLACIRTLLFMHKNSHEIGKKLKSSPWPMMAPSSSQKIKARYYPNIRCWWKLGSNVVHSDACNNGIRLILYSPQKLL